MDQGKDGDISSLAGFKLLYLGTPPWVPLPSSEASGEYYRVGFNHVIQAIKKKKGFNCLFL